MGVKEDLPDAIDEIQEVDSQSLKKRSPGGDNHMDDTRARIRPPEERNKCTNCLRGTLHCYNVVILIIGCGAVGVGIWYLVTEYSAREVTVVVGNHYFEVATYLLIAAGGTIALLAFCGCCGTMREDRCVLGFYSGTLTFMLLFLAVACGMAFYFRGQFQKKIFDFMLNSIERNYGIEIRTNSNNKLITDAWDSVQRELQCCGIKGNENSTFSWSVYKLRSEWYRRQTGRRRFEIPYVPESCCKKGGNVKKCTGGTNIRSPPAIGPPLGKSDQRNSELNTEGCLDMIRKHLAERAIILGIVAAAIPLLLTIGIVVSCCLCLRVGRTADEEESDL